MDITYLRQSSIGTYRDCEFKFFLETIIGLPSVAGKKALLGTIVHHVLELLARCKKNNHLVGKYVDYQYLLDICWKRYKKEEEHRFKLYPADYRFCKTSIEKVLNSPFNPLNLDILATEKRFILPINHPDFKYEFYDIVTKEIKRGYYEIRGTVDLITKIDNDTIEIIDWKGLLLDTPIPTLNGWTTMGDIKVGDLIFDSSGNITKVIGKSNKSRKPCYRIEFDDSTTIICDNEHLWKLNDGRVINTLKLSIGDKIEIAKPLKIKDVNLPTCPYVLGLFLGTKDSDPIPQIYLRASYNQRLALLRGLMDKRGDIDKKCQKFVFQSGNKDLLDSVRELLLTLGYNPSIRSTKIYFKSIGVNPFYIKSISSLNDKSITNVDKDLGYRSIKKIEYIGNKETQCIKVDSIDNTYLCTHNMIPTHNTGSRNDWITGLPKDYEYLSSKDIQLRLYDLAVWMMYPEYKYRLLTINFINDGGPYTVIFDDDKREETFEILKNEFNTIKNNPVPSRLKEEKPDQASWKCNRVCHFGKTMAPNGVCWCDNIHAYMIHNGVDETILKVNEIRSNRKVEIENKTSNRRNQYTKE